MSDYMKKLELWKPGHDMRMYTKHKQPGAAKLREEKTKQAIQERMRKSLEFIRQETYYADITLRIIKLLDND